MTWFSSWITLHELIKIMTCTAHFHTQTSKVFCNQKSRGQMTIIMASIPWATNTSLRLCSVLFTHLILITLWARCCYSYLQLEKLEFRDITLCSQNLSPGAGVSQRLALSTRGWGWILSQRRGLQNTSPEDRFAERELNQNHKHVSSAGHIHLPDPGTVFMWYQVRYRIS